MEEKLIPKILKGNEWAFRELYDLYATKAYRTALLITGNAHTAEDAVQETFIQCYRSLKKLKSPNAFGAYFYRTLTRTAWRLSSKDRLNLPLEDTLIADLPVEDKSYGELYGAIASLNIKLRTTIILFYFNDLSIKEIARITGTFEGTVKSRLYTAKQKLSNILKKEDFYG